MRHITVSGLVFLLVFPAFADVRLPAVNVSSGVVSARTAFGESVPSQSKQLTHRTVVARPSVQKQIVAQATKPVDSGADIVASNDVLSPRRPSNDLWARTSADVPLRMPSPSEFAVYRSNEILPEESLDSSMMPATYAYNEMPVQEKVAPVQKKDKKAILDEQIEQLVELQRRADESAKQVQPRVVARPSVIRSVPVETPALTVAQAEPETISVRRMVVPMEAQDVIVRKVEKGESPRIASVRDDMTNLSPSELRRAFKKTFLSENKHLSTYGVNSDFDVISDVSTSVAGFTSERDLSEDSDIRPLEIKISFRNDDAALSRENYNLLSEYAAIVVHNPKRAIQIAIPNSATKSADARKLAARRLAIVEQVLRDTGVSQQRIMPVLAQRNEDTFVLRMISNEQYETLSQQKRDMFGDTKSSKKYKSMSW